MSPRSVMRTHTHVQTHWSHTCYIKSCLHETLTDSESSWILQNIQVDILSAVVCTSRLTNRETVRQTDSQGPLCTGDTGGTDTSGCCSHPHKQFKSSVSFQAPFIPQLQVDSCAATSRGGRIQWPPSGGQWSSPHMSKAAMITAGRRRDGSLCEPVESAESLGNEVKESSAGVSPVLPVGDSMLWGGDRQ